MWWKELKNTVVYVLYLVGGVYLLVMFAHGIGMVR